MSEAPPNLLRELREVTLGACTPTRVRVTLDATGRFAEQIVPTSPEWVDQYARCIVGMTAVHSAEATEPAGPGSAGAHITGEGFPNDPLTFEDEVLALNATEVFRVMDPRALEAGTPRLATDAARLSITWRVTLPPGFAPDELPGPERWTGGTLRASADWRWDAPVLTLSLEAETTRGAIPAGATQQLQEWLGALQFSQVALVFGPLALAEAGRFAEAVRGVDALAVAFPDWPGAHAARAEVRRAAGLREAALLAADGLAEPWRSWTRGHVCAHDLAGGFGVAGFDRSGAIAGFRAATDAGHPEGGVMLAWALRHDEQAREYGHGSDAAAAADAHLAAFEAGASCAPDHLLRDLAAAGRMDDVARLVAVRLPHLAASEGALLAHSALHGAEAGWRHARRLLGDGRDTIRAFGKGWNTAVSRGDYALARAITATVPGLRDVATVGMHPVGPDEVDAPPPDGPIAAATALIAEVAHGGPLGELALVCGCYGPDAAVALFRGAAEVKERVPGVGACVQARLTPLADVAAWVAEEGDGWVPVAAVGRTDAAAERARACLDRGDATGARRWVAWYADSIEGQGWVAGGVNTTLQRIGLYFGRAGDAAMRAAGWDGGGHSDIARAWTAADLRHPRHLHAVVRAFSLRADDPVPDLGGLPKPLVDALLPPVIDRLHRAGRWSDVDHLVAAHASDPFALRVGCCRAASAHDAHERALALAAGLLWERPTDPDAHLRNVRARVDAGRPASDVLAAARRAARELSGTFPADLCWYLLFGDDDDRALGRRQAEALADAGRDDDAFLHTLATAQALAHDVDDALEPMRRSASTHEGALPRHWALVRALVGLELGDHAVARELVGAMPVGPWSVRTLGERALRAAGLSL